MSCTVTAGCYLALAVGMMAPDYTENSDEIEATNKVQPATSVVFGAAHDALAYELELAWHRDTLHGYNPGGADGEAGEQNADGNVNTFALLVNLRWRGTGAVAPYGVAGLGPAFQERDGQSAVTRTDLTRKGVYLAGKLGAGASLRLAAALEVDIGLRYFATEDQGQYGGVLALRYLF